MEVTNILVNLDKKSKVKTPAEYFADRVYKYSIDEYVPLRSYQRFISARNHFNRYIRKHLEQQEPVLRGSGKTTYIQFIYEITPGQPSGKQQKDFIYQWVKNGINDLLDSNHGCFSEPGMLLSPSGNLLMLYITVDWYV
jgi:hypothetical protein